MRDEAVFSSRWAGDAVELVDQTRLPDAVEVIRCDSDASLGEAIATLRVRGAPAIGVAAAMGVAAAAVRVERAGGDRDAIVGAARASAAYLRTVRPTAVNLPWACDRMARVAGAIAADVPVGDAVQVLVDEAREIQREERDACGAMASHGAALLEELCAADRPLRLLTHCNTGPLCTGGIGTAFGVVTTVHAAGRLEQLWVDETRPLLQGARITAWEADRLGMPHAVLSDNAAGSLFQAGQVDAVLIGADRVAANGDAANKVGSYPLAVLAAHHGVPFLVVAPTSTIDLGVPGGHAIEVEQRSEDEVRLARGATRLAPAASPAYNPAFDVTPAALIAALVTERGVVRSPSTSSLAVHVGSGTDAA